MKEYKKGFLKYKSLKSKYLKSKNGEMFYFLKPSFFLWTIFF